MKKSILACGVLALCFSSLAFANDGVATATASSTTSLTVVNQSNDAAYDLITTENGQDYLDNGVIPTDSHAIVKEVDTNGNSHFCLYRIGSNTVDVFVVTGLNPVATLSGDSSGHYIWGSNFVNVGQFVTKNHKTAIDDCQKFVPTPFPLSN